MLFLVNLFGRREDIKVVFVGFFCFQLAKFFFSKINYKMLEVELQVFLPELGYIICSLCAGVLLLGLEGAGKLSQLFFWLVDVVRVCFIAEGLFHFFKVLHKRAFRYNYLLGGVRLCREFARIRLVFPVLQQVIDGKIQLFELVVAGGDDGEIDIILIGREIFHLDNIYAFLKNISCSNQKSQQLAVRVYNSQPPHYQNLTQSSPLPSSYFLLSYLLLHTTQQYQAFLPQQIRLKKIPLRELVICILVQICCGVDASQQELPMSAFEQESFFAPDFPAVKKGEIQCNIQLKIRRSLLPEFQNFYALTEFHFGKRIILFRHLHAIRDVPLVAAEGDNVEFVLGLQQEGQVLHCNGPDVDDDVLTREQAVGPIVAHQIESSVGVQLRVLEVVGDNVENDFVVFLIFLSQLYHCVIYHRIELAQFIFSTVLRVAENIENYDPPFSYLFTADLLDQLPVDLLHQAGFFQIYFTRTITRFLIPNYFFADLAVLSPSAVHTHYFPNLEMGVVGLQEGPGFVDILGDKNKQMIMLKSGGVDASEIPAEDQALILIGADGKYRADSSAA